MSPLVLIGAGLGALVIIAVIVVVVRSRRNYVFLHVPESADSASQIPEALRMNAPEPSPQTPVRPEPVVPAQVPPANEPETAPAATPPAAPVPAPAPTPAASPASAPAASHAPASPPVPAPVESPAATPAPTTEAHRAFEQVDPRQSVADFAMEAPVEVWLGDVRVGIRAGSASHKAFLKYANTLLDDLKAARSISR